MVAAASLPRWAARDFRGPRTIDEALADAAEGGTHSVLDVTHTADLPEIGAAVPLGRRKLVDSFGTTEPTVEQVTDRAGEILDGVERWEAVYVTVYRDVRPDGIMFFWCSGD